ncbi:MAG: heme biosynthesis protein HemY, partial [Candidatus Binataceae bacterium]
AALTPYLSAPTRRVATLMADIEEAEHGDEGRVREWMARAMRASGDPAWTADGVVSEHWMPVSPNGRLDGFTWKVPLAEIGVSRPVIEAPPPKPVVEPVNLAPPLPDAQPTAQATPEPPVRVPAEPAARPGAKAAAKPLAKPAAKPAAKTKPPEPIIPLVLVPDDPGPDASLEADPMPETTSPPPLRDTWQRLRQLFR